MKQITPIGIWYNGQIVQANYLQLNCSSDNLVDTAVFNYSLIDVESADTQTLLTQGQLIMTGAEYDTNWDTNDQAYNWAASKMNIAFV